MYDKYLETNKEAKQEHYKTLKDAAEGWDLISSEGWDN